MNAGLELHDSDVAQVTLVGRTLRVVFRPGYVHRSEGVPGSDSGWGYLQPVEFTFGGASLFEEGECLGTVASGTVRSADLEYANLVPMPLALSGSVSAELEFTSGGVLKVSAEAFTCSAIGEPDPDFRERYEG